MAVTGEHTVLLDQLQSQVNLILEQTGRVFAAVSSNPKVPPLAQANRLRTIIPTATGRFHKALDLLEEELHTASFVMLRDLAVCRERSGQQAPLEVQPPPAQKSETESADVSPPDAQKEADAKPLDRPNAEVPVAETTANEDVAMQDSQQDDAKPIVSFDELIADEKMPDETITEGPPLADTKPSVAAHTLPALDSPVTEDKPPANEGLHIDTTTATGNNKADERSAADSDQRPDTANDLDSLFGGPMSATGGENNDFNFDHDGSGAIDFGSFDANFDANGADNDNISSLLPGLQDYANTQPNASDVDLNVLFGTASGGDVGNDSMGSQGAGEPRDTTFDDLMDLANFDSGDVGGDGSNNNQDFDFDSLFN